MEIKKSLQTIKHMFRSLSCINCTQPLGDIIIEIDEGKILCPTCMFKYEPTQLCSDGEIINLAELLNPDDHDKFLSNAGFRKRFKRRTSKFALVFLIVIMAAGAMVDAAIKASTLDKLFIGILFAVVLIVQILYYKAEEKLEWYRER